jgi:rhodanese-related sulfurtransferase
LSDVTATEVIGGFRAWRLAGLPVVRAIEDGT